MYYEIDNQPALVQLLANSTGPIKRYAFQSLNFFNLEVAKDIAFEDCIFLGCELSDKVISQNIDTSCYVFPRLTKPFDMFPNSLYSHETLFNGYEVGNPMSYSFTYDKQVYDHYINFGKEASDIGETLARRLHDHSITDALFDFLNQYHEKKIVAIMGGHSLPRDSETYKTVVLISKLLTEKGYLLVSGGGPGAMEATHLGAIFAGKSSKDIDDALETLAHAPSYKDELWLDTSFQVLSKYGLGEFESLGVPTWLYGHEPPTPFASKIAKYFANSVREDGLLAIGKGGVVFAPGSAGTIQEIFQDACQNHYLNYGFASPMVFLDSNYWTE